MRLFDRVGSTLGIRGLALCVLLVCLAAVPAYGSQPAFADAGALRPVTLEATGTSPGRVAKPDAHGIAASAVPVRLAASSGEAAPDPAPPTDPTGGPGSSDSALLRERALFRQAFGSKAGEAGFRQDLDLNGDGIIDSGDRNLLRKRHATMAPER